MPLDGLLLSAAALSAAAPIGLAVLASAFVGARWGPALRIAAVVVAVGVVAWNVVPHLLEGPFLSVGGLFLAGLLGPLLLGRLVERVRGSGGDALGAGVALGGLALHQMGDGLTVGGAWAMDAGPTVSLAVAAHSVPLVAASLHLVAEVGGLSQARRAGVLLAGVSAASAAAGAIGAPLLPAAESWLPPLLAGLVLNLVLAGLTHHHPVDPAQVSAE